MKKTIFLTQLFLFSFLVVNAQVKLPSALAYPIEQALMRSEEIKSKQLDLARSSIEQKEVTGMFIPRVDATGGYGYFNNQVTMDVPNYKLPITGAELFDGKTKIHNQGQVAHAGISATSILFSGMQITNGSKALQQKALGDSLLIETDKDNLVLDVVNSFDKLRFVWASETLLDDSEKRLNKEAERVNKAIENDLAVPFDRDKIKLARLELEMKRTELESSKKLLLSKITYLTGMSSKEIEAVYYELDPILLPSEMSVENKQELAALEAYKRASELLVKKEKGAYFPQVAAFAGLSYSSLFHGSADFDLPNLPSFMNQPSLRLNELTLAPNFVVGVGLKWNIFGGMERKREVQKAKIGVKQLEGKLEDSRQKLNLLLTQKQSIYQTQLKKVDLSAQKKKVAEHNLEMAKIQYAQGLISVSQRLEAENDFIAASQQAVDVLIDLRQAALEASMVTGNLAQNIIYVK